jgi:hypothetical protein
MIDSSLSSIFDQPGAEFVFLRSGKKYPPIENEWQHKGHSFEEAKAYNGNVGAMAGNDYIGLDQDKPEAFDGLALLAEILAAGRW